MKDPRYLTFPPDRLQQLITEKGITNKDFALMMGVSTVQARQWIQGKSQPHRTKLSLFFQAFGLETEEQLYHAELAKKYSDAGFSSIGLGSVDFGGLLVRLDGLAKSRMLFWNTLRETFILHSMKIAERRWQSLDELLDTVPPPPGLPLPAGERILDYPALYGKSLTGPAAALYSFSTAVYAAFAPGRTLEELSIVAKGAFEPFHFARMDFAKVWNRIGQLVNDNTIEFAQVIERVPTGKCLVNVISYLEIALAQWCRDRGPGKVYLFHLNKAWQARP